MDSQTELLKKTDWNVLIVLDACRADYFQRLCNSAAATVHSDGVNTRQWFSVTRSSGILQEAKYINANPIVTDETQSGAGEVFDVEHVTDGWSKYDTVPPQAMNARVKNYLERAGQPQKLVIHYMQPHAPALDSWQRAAPYWNGDAPPKMCPYVGPLAHFWAFADLWLMEKLGLQEIVLSMEQHSHIPDCSLFDKTAAYFYAQFRRFSNMYGLRGHTQSAPRTYAANLIIVWEHLQEVIQRLRGRIVITGDHGEMLGERGGLRGHRPDWDYPELREVPWLVIDRGDFRPSPLRKHRENESSEMQLKARLESLGYL